MTTMRDDFDYNDRYPDEISDTYDCDNCNKPVEADWFRTGDDVYETDCPHCGLIATIVVDLDDGGDAAYEAYRDFKYGY